MSEPARTAPGVRDFLCFGLPALALLGLLVLPLITGRGTLVLRDVLRVHLMLKVPLARALRAGYFPLIDPLRMGGAALAGNPNALPFYPDNLLFLVARLLWAFNAHFWIHLLLAPALSGTALLAVRGRRLQRGALGWLAGAGWPPVLAGAEWARWVGLAVASLAIAAALLGCLALTRTRPRLGTGLLLAVHVAGQVYLLGSLAVSDSAAFYRQPPPALAAVPPGSTVVNAQFFDLFGAPAGPQGKLRLLARGPELLEVAVDTPVPGVLVVQRTDLPVWRASVDGAPAGIEPANLYRMGARVAAGRHRVRLWVDRRPLEWSAAVGLASLVGLAILAGLAPAPRGPEPTELPDRLAPRA